MYGLPPVPSSSSASSSAFSSTQTVTQTVIKQKIGTPQSNTNIKLLQEYIKRNTSILAQLETSNNKEKADARLELLTSEIRLKIKHIAEK